MTDKVLAEQEHGPALDLDASPSLVQTPTGWLAVGTDHPRIGVMASTRDETLALFRERRAAWRALSALCACAPRCPEQATATEFSPNMDSYCHECTMRRCDVAGHEASTGQAAQ